MYALNDLIVPGTLQVLDTAVDINDDGLIAAYSTTYDRDANVHGLLLTPVPEPATAVSWLCLMIAMTVRSGPGGCP
jgi:hypothetical protein